MVEITDADADALLRLTLHLAQRDFTKVVDDLANLGFFLEELEPATAATARRIARSIIGRGQSISTLFGSAYGTSCNLYRLKPV